MPLAIEDVVGAERDHVAARQDVVDAALHQPADVEVVGVEERRDRDPEDVGLRELLGQGAGEELGRGGRDRVGGVRRRPSAGAAADAAAADLAEVLLDELPRRGCGVKRMPLARMSRCLRASMNRVRGTTSRPSGRRRSGCGSSGGRRAAA